MFVVYFSISFSEEDEAKIWYVDSQTPSHMTGNRSWFESFKETTCRYEIYLDDICYDIKGYSDIPVMLPCGEMRHIKNVMYVLAINNKLISVLMIEDHDVEVEFFKKYWCHKGKQEGTSCIRSVSGKPV